MAAPEQITWDSVARLARLTEIAEEIENVYVMETVEWFALKEISVYDCISR